MGTVGSAGAVEGGARRGGSGLGWAGRAQGFWGQWQYRLILEC